MGDSESNSYVRPVTPTCHLAVHFCNLRRSFPFKQDGKTGSDANYTDKFFTREGDQQTQAFTEALLLANMYATTPFLQCIIATFGQVL
jgi:hypothetical protein